MILTEDAKKSALYDRHVALADKSRIVPFAGYLMPLWYSSIAEEHRAVRERAGLFDCTHMGVLQFEGMLAENFLQFTTTNNVERLTDGKAHYGFFLDEQGHVLDDIIVYRRDEERYMVVVNASNEPKIKKWLLSLHAGMEIKDADGEIRGVPVLPDIVDLRHESLGPATRVDLALQGPASLELVTRLVDHKTARDRLTELRPFNFIETTLQGFEVILSRTGYTGAAMGFEIFAAGNDAGQVWDAILKGGADLGVLPCGLGARDSLRIEAGLPLYGHELAGKFAISPFEAGYDWAVKLDKDFFIGKGAMGETGESYDMTIQRLEIPGRKGIRPVRENDAVLDGHGNCLGWILSSAKSGDSQIALAYIDRDSVFTGDAVGLYYVARNQRHIDQGKVENAEKGQPLDADIEGKVIERFAKF
jgi:glycine hydroxymethyltransferase